ncbi:hypothetical protein Tco_1375532 [Tanacetum coccineum]
MVVMKLRMMVMVYAVEDGCVGVAKDLWGRIQLLMQGTSLTKQERKYKLYDAFDKFAHIKGESLHQYYLRFTQLINDMNIYKMKLEQFQVNTKFLNSLSPEWSKFVTDVKLVKYLHTTNFDQLHAYLQQHELHANEVHAYPQPQSVPQIEYIVSIVNQQTHLVKFPQIDSDLAVPVFKQGDDPIDAINKMMSFLSIVVTSRFPSTNNQLRNSSNPRQQATVHDGRKTKRKRDATWFRDKVLLVEAQENGKVLNEKELKFLADLGIAEGTVTQMVITHNAAYQADDLDAYDSDCNYFSTAKVVLMANLSSYGSDFLSENEITSDSNIIPYSQYMLETQNATVKDTNSSTQQDAMILTVFEQLSNQVTTCNKVNKDNLIANESLSVELERYKERVKLLEERQNVDLRENQLISHCELEETLMLELNRLSEDFCKRFVPQQELSGEQAFRLQTLNPNTNQSASSLVKIEAPRELPKVSLVNTSLKKLKYHLGQFDNVVKKRIMPDALTEGEWGFVGTLLKLKGFCHNNIKNDLRKFKGKDIVDNAAQASNATTIAPRMYKLDLVTLAPKDKNNRETHIYYLKYTMETKLAILGDRFVRETYALLLHKPVKWRILVMSALSTKGKQLGVSRSIKSIMSKSTDNTKNDKILQISSSTQKKNKVGAHFRIVKSCLNKPNCVVKPSGIANVQHSKLNTNSELMCVICNSSKFDARHELCFLEFVFDMNASSKSKSVKKAKKKEEWKPTRKVFTKIGYNWRPTGRNFTLVGNVCPLTRITSTNKVPFREPIPLKVVAQESVVTKVYTRRPKVPKTNGSNSKPKIAKSVISNKTKPGTSWGSNTLVAPSSSSLSISGYPNFLVVFGLRMFQAHD